MVGFQTNAFLKISNSSLFPKFLNDCCDEILSGTPLNLSNYNNDVEWTTEDINKTKKSIQDFFCSCTINDAFVVEENISNAARIALKECFVIHKQDFEHDIIKNGFAQAGHNVVQNIDWRLKWILGSSKLARYQEPILQLDLSCFQKEREHLKNQKKTINFEMNLEQMDYFIEVLQNVKMNLS